MLFISVEGEVYPPPYLSPLFERHLVLTIEIVNFELLCQMGQYLLNFLIHRGFLRYLS
ncbi:MAG: hypothetical protein LBJ88_01485 [Campylobacteraceae bacterium]|nr:hypothetical protein [Campylobacteraceae bacterium]